MERSRWTFNALYENMNNNSQYYKYINKIRDELKINRYITKDYIIK